ESSFLRAAARRYDASARRRKTSANRRRQRPARLPTALSSRCAFVLADGRATLLYGLVSVALAARRLGRILRRRPHARRRRARHDGRGHAFRRRLGPALELAALERPLD